VVLSNEGILPKPFRSSIVRAIFLIGLVAITYLPVLHAGFIWDDDVHLTENPCIIGPLGFEQIWTSSRAIYYPLVATTFWILHWFVGLNPLPYHLFNILVHSGAAIVLWQVLRKLEIRGAWFGAALWAVHPVMVESVAWITELKNTQSGLFYLLSILFFLEATDESINPKSRRCQYGFSLLFFALATTSKSSTVMLPVVLMLCLWWSGRKLIRYGFVIAPFVVVALAASLWTIWEQKFHAGAQGADWSINWMQRFAIAGRDVWFYIGKLVWPRQLIFVYPRWEIDSTAATSLIPTIACTAAVVFLWWRRNRKLRPIFFAAAYFVVSLFPVLGFFNVYFFRYSFVSDHFQYLASMGPLALAGAAIVKGADSLRSSMRWMETAACAVLLIVEVGLSWHHEPAYQNLETLWRDTIAKNPGCWLAHTNLGVYLNEKGDRAEAIAHYQQALASKPDFPEALTSLGAYEAQIGEIQMAMQHFREALRASPRFGPAWYNLGNALADAGKVEESIAAYQNALTRDSPVYFEASNRLGVALSREGKSEEAIPHFAEALSLKPNDAGVHNNLGFALAELNRFDEAIDQLQQSIRLNPTAAQTYVNLGQVYARLGNRTEAIANFKRALAIDPNHAEAKYRLQQLGAMQ
jgi:tetratricopeptide (TPR) repeat protein